MPRRATIAPRRAPVERAQLGSRPFNCPCALLVAKAVAQLGGLGADFGKCTLQRVHGSLLACRPAACLSDRRPPVILYSAILWGVLSQPLRRSPHELANLGQHMARGFTRAVTGV